MGPKPGGLKELVQALHRHLFWLLAGAYLLAAVGPGPGLWLRSTSLGTPPFPGGAEPVTLPAVMLAFLLFNAGVGVRPSRLRGLPRRLLTLLAGLAANLLVPLAFALVVSRSLTWCWHDPDEAQCVLVGLALAASIPMAGSSSAWSQNAGGDLALSLGLVLGSTALSPLTTPVALHAAGLLASGEYALGLNELAGRGTGAFLVIWVLVPSLLGLAVRRLLGEARADRVVPVLKTANNVNLLLLCYANATASLPEALNNPDLGFLAITLVVVTALCAVGFGAGWLVGGLLNAEPGQRTALMFGLGMNNNGTSLVLASRSLSAYPRAILPVILYNLVQHLIAAAVAVRVNAKARFASPTPATEPAVNTAG